MLHTSRSVFVALAMMVGVGCGSPADPSVPPAPPPAPPPPPIPVVSIHLAPSRTSLETREVILLRASPLGGNGFSLLDRRVDWSVEPAGVVTVNQGGVLVAVGAGAATVTAASEGRVASRTFTVSAAAPLVGSLMVETLRGIEVLDLLHGTRTLRWPGARGARLSPTDDRIVMETDTGLVVSSLDGSNALALAGLGRRGRAPAWMGDGLRIAFQDALTNAMNDYPSATYVMRLADQAILATANAGSAWGSTFAFVGPTITASAGGGIGGVANADLLTAVVLHLGPHPTATWSARIMAAPPPLLQWPAYELTEIASGWNPAWSPLGELAFVRSSDYFDPPLGPGEIWTSWPGLEPGGERPWFVRGVIPMFTYGHPVWSPDGEWLAFRVTVAETGASIGIAVARREGTVHLVLSDDADARPLEWRAEIP